MITDEDVDDFLAHYGVLGMRWGRRKAESQERIDRGEHTSPKNPNNVATSDDGGSRSERRAAKIQSRAQKKYNKMSDRDKGIVDARVRQQKRADEVAKKANEVVKANTTNKGAEQAFKAYEKAQNSYVNNPDATVAAQMTKGEKWANGFGIAAYGGIIAATLAYTAIKAR